MSGRSRPFAGLPPPPAGVRICCGRCGGATQMKAPGRMYERNEMHHLPAAQKDRLFDCNRGRTLLRYSRKIFGGFLPERLASRWWKNTGKEGKKEIFHRQQREEKGWCKEDFFWVDINSDQADLLLFNGVLEYIDMSVS